MYVDTCYYHLRQIRSVRRSLTTQAASALIHAFISSRIDFGNAIYSGLGSSLTLKLQSVLNASARLIGGIPKFGHISTYMRDTLHWLPIPQASNLRF